LPNGGLVLVVEKAAAGTCGVSGNAVGAVTGSASEGLHRSCWIGVVLRLFLV